MMRPDQLVRLQELAEKLAERFMLEADPAEWPGEGQVPADMTQQERGDAYWCKKNAMATGGVLRFTMDILAKQTPEDPTKPVDPAKESDMDRQIRDAERRSAQLVEDAIAAAKRKPEFDKRVSGK
jgi:hypothetical protein